MEMLNNSLAEAEQKLTALLQDLGSLGIAYSGGVDSTLLLAFARQTLGKEKVIAYTAVSETYSRRELARAKELAQLIDVKHEEIITEELTNDCFALNPDDRCYFCKTELFGKLLDKQKTADIAWIADGTTLSDINDHRPGRKAAQEKGVRSPLLESGLGKEEVRALAKKLRLPNWNAPAMACLASRVPYGTRLTAGMLRIIEEAEEALTELGLETFRVRHHDAVARVELGISEMKSVLSSPKLRRGIVEKLQQCGYTYIALDLEGYRSGSMNQVLTGTS